MPSSIINPIDGRLYEQNKRAPGGATTLVVAETLVQTETNAGAVGVTFPANPDDGDGIGIEDVGLNASANNITIGGNGKLIDGAASLVLSEDGVVASFVYDGGQWRRLVAQRDYPNVPPPATFSRSSETGSGGGTVIPDPLIVNDLVVNVSALIELLDVTTDAVVGGDVSAANLLASGVVDADSAVLTTDVTAGGDVSADACIATTRVIGPYFSAVTNPALLGNVGYVRAPDSDTVIVSGLSAGTPYDGFVYQPSGAAWVMGNGSQYSSIVGFSVSLQGGLGCSAYDGRSGITTDLTRVEQYLLSNFATSSTTRQSTNLGFPIAAGETWSCEVDGALSSSGSTGGRLSIAVPAGASAWITVFGATSGSTAYVQDYGTSVNALIAVTLSNAAAANRMFRLAFVVVNGGTGGTVTIQVATVTSGTITMAAGTKLSARRVTGV